MDFGLSEEQNLLRETVRRFLSDRCPTTRVREVMEGETGHDPDLWAGLAELGIPALAVPVEMGGLGSEFLDLALVAEEFGYAATPGPLLGSVLATIALAQSSNDSIAKRWLERLATGEVIGSIAYGEAESRWDPRDLNTVFEDGRLRGEKMLVPYVDVADFFVVAANDSDGPGLFFVERDAPGMSTSQLHVNDLTRRLGVVSFEGTPAEKIGDVAVAQRVLDAGLILVAADAYGGARRCLEMTRDYSLEREQFGQPIGAFQAYKHQLADLASDLEPSMSLYWFAAHAYDALPDQSARHAAMAKALLGELFNRMAFACTELHGGIGFTYEYDLQLWFRRALFDKGFLGEAAMHQDRAAAMAGW